ncbi:MAG TPA: spermidine/putrescine ABC transporter [Gammaproteobacteria bacterium]|mgnify:FL=1|nr:spermidine/putrescine ABC transporter [Acidiferrobacteraceae bacterium]MDP6140312.1 ABC transporter permease [Arenicellales bacterium]HCV21607.1 spermidine/putrescine ABC transporter [Gammaproteobacteria bacterium]MDP6313864.1 ABC transporter permease [Arenicellales bacterium]MDP7193451.1 ABC transporter permease [Arenicellales bacterium]
MKTGRTWWRPDGFLVYAVAYLVFIYLPVLFLPLFSFNNSKYIAFPLKGFTLKWYQQMLNSPSMLEALMNSIKVGLIVALLSTILGLMAAKAVTRYRLPGRGPVISFIMVPLVIPEIILAISLLILISQADIPLSLWTVGFSHLLLCTPFAMLVLVSRMEGFDRSLEEAALDLGENSWMTFWRVTFPIVLPGIVASMLLTFTISFDEFVLAFFLTSTDATLPIYIWSSLRFPTKIPAVLALGASIFVISFFVVSFAEWLRRRGVKMEATSRI